METDKVVNGNVPLKRMTVALRRLPNRYLQHLIAYRQKRHKNRPKFISNRQHERIPGQSVSSKTGKKLLAEGSLKRNDMSGKLAAQKFRSIQGKEHVFVTTDSHNTATSSGTPTTYVMSSTSGNNKKFVKTVSGQSITENAASAMKSSKKCDTLFSIYSSERKSTESPFHSQQLSYYNIANCEHQEKNSMKSFQEDKLQSCRESSFRWPKSLAKVTVDEPKKSAQSNHKPTHAYPVTNIWESYQAEFQIADFNEDCEKMNGNRTENCHFEKQEKAMSTELCIEDTESYPPPLISQEAFLPSSNQEDEDFSKFENNSEAENHFDAHVESSTNMSNGRNSIFIESFKPASNNMIPLNHEKKKVIYSKSLESELTADISVSAKDVDKIDEIISEANDISLAKNSALDNSCETANCEMNNNNLNNINLFLKGHNCPKLAGEIASCVTEKVKVDHPENVENVHETNLGCLSSEIISKVPYLETKTSDEVVDQIKYNSELQSQSHLRSPKTLKVPNSTETEVVFKDAYLSNCVDKLHITSYRCEQSDNGLEQADNGLKQGDNGLQQGDNAGSSDTTKTDSIHGSITKQCDQLIDQSNIVKPIYDGLPDFVPLDELSIIERQLAAQNQYKIEVPCKEYQENREKYEDEINCNIEALTPQEAKEKDQIKHGNDHNSTGNFTLTTMPDLLPVSDDIHNDALLTPDDNYNLSLNHPTYPRDRVLCEDSWPTSQEEAMDEEWSGLTKSTSVRDEYMGAGSPLKLVIEDVRSCPDYIHDGMEQSVLGIQSEAFDYDPSLPTLESQFITLGDGGVNCLDSSDFVSDHFNPETDDTHDKHEGNLGGNLDISKESNEIPAGNKRKNGAEEFENVDKSEEKNTELKDNTEGLSKNIDTLGSLGDKKELRETAPGKGSDSENKKLDSVVNRLRGRLRPKKYNYDEEFLDDPDFITYSDSDTENENKLKLKKKKSLKTKSQLVTKTVRNNGNKKRMELTKRAAQIKRPQKKLTRLDKIKAQLRKSGLHNQTKTQSKPIVKKFNLRKRPMSNMELVLPTLVTPKRIRALPKLNRPVELKESLKPKLKPDTITCEAKEKTKEQEKVTHNDIDEVNEKPVPEKLNDIKARKPAQDKPLSPPKKRAYHAEETQDKEKEAETVSPSCEPRRSPPLTPPKKRRSTETCVPGRKPKKVKPSTPPPDPALYTARLSSDLPNYNWLEAKIMQQEYESKENCSPNTEKDKPAAEARRGERSPSLEAKKNLNVTQGEIEKEESNVKPATKDEVSCSPETISPRSVCKKLAVLSSSNPNKTNENVDKEKLVNNSHQEPTTKSLQVGQPVTAGTEVQTSQIVAVPLVTSAVLQPAVPSTNLQNAAVSRVVQNAVPVVIMPAPVMPTSQSKPLTPVPLVATVLPMPTSKPPSMTLCHSTHSSNQGKPKQDRHTIFEPAPQRVETSLTVAVPVQNRSVPLRWSSADLQEPKTLCSPVETSPRTKNAAVSPVKEINKQLMENTEVKLTVAVPEEKLTDGKLDSPVEPLDFSMKKFVANSENTTTYNTEEVINIEPEPEPVKFSKDTGSPEVMDLSQKIGQQDKSDVANSAEVITISPNAPVQTAEEPPKRDSIDLTLNSSKHMKYKPKEKVEIDLTQCPANDEEQTYAKKFPRDSNKGNTHKTVKHNLSGSSNQSVFRRMRDSIHRTIEDERSVRNVPTAVLTEFQRINQTIEKVNRYLKNICERRKRLCTEVYERYGVVLDQKTFDIACSKFDSNMNRNPDIGGERQAMLRAQAPETLPGKTQEISQHGGVQVNEKERRSGDMIRTQYPPMSCNERPLPQQQSQKPAYMASQTQHMPVPNVIPRSPKQTHNSGGTVSIHSAFSNQTNPYPVQLPQKSVPCSRNGENVHLPEGVLPRPIQLEMPVNEPLLPPPPAYTASYPNQAPPIQHAQRRPPMEGRRAFQSPGVPGYAEQREQYPSPSDRQFIHKEHAMQTVPQQAQMVHPYMAPAQRPFPRLERPGHNVRHPGPHDVTAFRRPEARSPQRTRVQEQHPRMMPPTPVYPRPPRKEIPIPVNDFNEQSYNSMQGCPPIHQMGQPRHAFPASWTNGASKSTNYMDAHVSHGHLIETPHSTRGDNVPIYGYHGPSNNVHGDFPNHHPCNIQENSMPPSRPHMHQQQNIPPVLPRPILPKAPVNQHQSIPPRVKTPPPRPTERPAPAPPRQDDQRKGACAVCGGSAVYLCSGCKNTWYCTKTCQATGWETHRMSCQ